MTTDQKSNSPTPRTDEQLEAPFTFATAMGHVPASFARQLEIELNEALKNVHELNSFDAPIELQKARAELAEWRECATALSKCVPGVCDEDIVALDRFNELSQGK